MLGLDESIAEGSGREWDDQMAVVFAEVNADWAEHFIWKGEIDPPAGPAEEDADAYLRSVWNHAHREPGVEVPKARRDYVRQLQSEAYAQIERGHEEIGLVLLVTAIEHVIHDCLTRGMQEAEVEPKMIKRKLRFEGFREKCSGLWSTYVGDSMPPSMRDVVLDVVQARNDFVHMNGPDDYAKVGDDIELASSVDAAHTNNAAILLGALLAVEQERFFKGFDRREYVDAFLACHERRKRTSDAPKVAGLEPA